MFALLTIYLYAAGLLQVSQETLIQLAVAKLILFSLLYFAIVWCGKNYRAHQHNAVINKHRRNALRTFQAFAKAASDEQTNNAVLLKATEAIFLPGTSGYISGESESQGSTQILEILRSGFAKGP